MIKAESPDTTVRRRDIVVSPRFVFLDRTPAGTEIPRLIFTSVTVSDY